MKPTIYIYIYVYIYVYVYVYIFKCVLLYWTLITLPIVIIESTGPDVPIIEPDIEVIIEPGEEVRQIIFF